jgi:hypothetical protein
MANPLPPDIPPSFWDDYRKRIEADLAQVRKDLAHLESGEMRLGERKVDGPWRDITEQWIKHYKHTIGTFEAMLAALNKKEPL